jgi:hypothetical protein
MIVAIFCLYWCIFESATDVSFVGNFFRRPHPQIHRAISLQPPQRKTFARAERFMCGSQAVCISLKSTHALSFAALNYILKREIICKKAAAKMEIRTLNFSQLEKSRCQAKRMENAARHFSQCQILHLLDGGARESPAMRSLFLKR